MKYLNLVISLTFYFLPAYLFYRAGDMNLVGAWLFIAWIGAIGINEHLDNM